MLYTPHNDCGWTLDNWGATFAGANLGTSIAAHATNAHVKGTAVSIWAGSLIVTDVYEVYLTFLQPSVAVTRFLIDLLVDPAGGTSWSVVVANIAVNTPNFTICGSSYHFPITIKAGSSIGLQMQCSTAAVTLRAMVVVRGKPSRPELVQSGYAVQTLGAVTASTEGTAFTPGTNAMGSYSASLGTLTRNAWYWQLGHVISDATQTAQIVGVDVAAGDASNKIICGQAFWHTEPSTTETAGKCAFPFGGLPYRNAPAGSNVYVRSWANTTPDTGNTAIVYAVT